MKEPPDESRFVLADLPPSKGQLRLALSVVGALLITFAALAPFADTQLPRVDAFIPILATATVINGLITSLMLFSQFYIVPRPALLVLASGFLCTGLITIPHALSFPGLFAPAGLLGAGIQTTVWLWIFWHAGSPLAVIIYVFLKDINRETGTITTRSPGSAIGWSVAAAFAAVCGLTWIATAGDGLLPQVFLDGLHINTSLSVVIGGTILLLNTTAFALLWFRRRSVLDVWLMVMCCTGLIEDTIAATLIHTRFSLGWYAGLSYGLITTFVVLLALLSEMTTLYANLARTVMRQRSEREARQIAMEGMAASIAHEVNQPLGAIALNSQAALAFLARTPLRIDELREAIDAIASDSVRGSEVVASLRTMFKRGNHGRVSLNVNDVVRDVLTLVDIDLRGQAVSLSTELHPTLPRLLADRGQLQQVLLNLILNAIEAMRTISDRPRHLRVRSEVIQGSSGVLIAVEDTGVGINKRDKGSIYDPFFTTKSTGTGIGLTICRWIVEAHGGNLRASANRPHGTIFHVALPETHPE